MKRILRNIFHVDHIIVSALTIGVVGLLVFVTVNLEFLNPVVQAAEAFSMTDIYYLIQHSGKTEENHVITIVDIGDLSIRDRDKIAGVVEEIHSMEPTMLGVDVVFQLPSEYIGNDDLLAEAFLKSPDNTVFALELSKPDKDKDVYTDKIHSFFNADGQLSEGTTNVVNNPHRSMTSYPTYYVVEGDTIFSLPAQMARQLGADMPTTPSFTINYRGTKFPVVKWEELQEKRELIENRIVLLGAEKDMTDMHLTPLGQRPGTEIVAYSLLSLLEGNHKKEAPFVVYLLWALLAGWMTNVIDLFFTKRVEGSKSTLVLFFLKSGLYARLVSFAILVLFTYISFKLYINFDYDLSSVLALSTSVLIGEGRLLYTAFLSVLKRKGFNIWKKSIYASIV